ncbi:hypothetical protein ERJ75_001323200 [Trypanosoma vivax]|nr:hypothetical protein ERJ75_001323200 [Trypanosoma vivax]
MTSLLPGTSGQLVSIAAYDLGTVNPQTYQVSFVPRVGTRPVLTFAGFDLTTEDRVMLVPEGYSCDDEYAVASGAFIKQGWSSESTRFHLPLIGVAHGSYTVCYDAGGSFGYVQMREPLAVRPGGPSSYVLSNTPMLGRPTEVLVEHSTYAASVNDGLRITCASCSCFEESEVDLAFGLPSVTVTEASKDVRLRFGVSKQSAFAVCYRVHDSGYARVGNSLIRLTPSWPQRAAVPSTSIMQGQRFVVELAGPAADGAEANNSPHAFSDGDALALVASRGCWDNPASNRAGVLTTFSSPVEVTKAKGRWRTLVPSLGPRKQLLESPSEYIVCYRESGQEEFLEVPLEGGVHTISPVQPAAFTTSPEVVMRGMLDVKLTFPRAVSGDAAYIVSFDGDEVVSDDVCDSGKPVTGPATAAFPSFRFNVPRHLEQKPLVVCYIKAGATVAEVPQLLEICPTNPERYVVESASSGLVRQHEYATLTFVGEGLSAEEDAVAFRDEPCAASH